MSEPPILPNAKELSNENPFAPSYAGTFAGGVPRVNLDATYWIAVTVLLVGIVTMFLLAFPLRWVAVVACSAAAIRVPLIQRKYYREVTDAVPAGPDLPSPLALLFSSLALNIGFIVVSFIAFMTVCIPGTIAFGFGDLNNTVFWVSTLVSLVCFGVLFFLSLRFRF